MWGDQEPPKDNWQAVCKPLDVGEPATAIDIGPGIIKGLRLVIAYCGAENNGRSPDNVRPDSEFDGSNFLFAGHVDRSHSTITSK